MGNQNTRLNPDLQAGLSTILAAFANLGALNEIKLSARENDGPNHDIL